MPCLKFLHSRIAFLSGSLSWLPAGIMLAGLVRNFSVHEVYEPWPVMVPMMILQLAVIAPCGLPLALACRQLSRKGYTRAAWIAMGVLAPVTIWASLFAGLLGPIAIALYAGISSLPVWIAAIVLRSRE